MRIDRSCRARCVAAVLALWAIAARADLGQTEIAATAQDGPVTVFYASQAAAVPVKRGRLTLALAVDAPPQPGNGRLVVISHGSGGSPWVHSDLARRLVAAGFVVALPEHHADNYKDDSDPGPDSWTLRPFEVSRAIDAVGRDPRFAPLLRLDRVGVYGMSAGGHTALTLAGGRWSPQRFMAHCDAHLADDFQACVGLATRLTGGPLDGLKSWLALRVIDHRFDDPQPRAHTDPRVAAVVAAVPFAADFDLDSLARPVVPLGLVLARGDRWLIPRWHGERVLQVCHGCVLIAELDHGGHGALLSPLPPGLTGLLGDLLNDPPGFDRSELPAVDAAIVAFFVRHVVEAPASNPG